jgi:catechol 2,3-dioxygenase-like lactoylglutathione lyase family enzyme
MPQLAGIHHLKLPVSDLAGSQTFYEQVFGARRIPEADHVDEDGHLYAVICAVPGLGTLVELRLNPVAAERQAGFDPVTIAVESLVELDAWIERLDELGVPHSGRLAGIQAWLTAFDDPDHHRLRLYTLQQHGPEIAPSTGNPWLSDATHL